MTAPQKHNRAGSRPQLGRDHRIPIKSSMNRGSEIPEPAGGGSLVGSVGAVLPRMHSPFSAPGTPELWVREVVLVKDARLEPGPFRH